jgi:hypothetical protein
MQVSPIEVWDLLSLLGLPNFGIYATSRLSSTMAAQPTLATNNLNLWRGYFVPLKQNLAKHHSYLPIDLSLVVVS